jgi:geranylgeranyl diphosphate synthase type II
MDFILELDKKRQRIDQALLKYMPKCMSSYDKIIYEAMEYSLMAGGKRLRPILMLQAFEICGGNNISDIEAFMVSMEMIHTYSLIHDDLPAMDNDDYRRGKLTCHKKYGEDIGILAGDGLLNTAYEIMIKSCLEEQNNTMVQQKLKALEQIGNAAGVSGMIGGQVVDVLNNAEMNLDMINYINIHKTSAIIEASLISGAILANANIDEVERFRKIGRCLGIAFQIQDDILDIVSTTEELGKQVGSDSKNGKATYVALKGLQESKLIVDELISNALDELQKFNSSKAIFLDELILHLKDRKK